MSANREIKESAPATNAPNMLDAALAYAEDGVAVFPLQNPLPDGSCSCRNTTCGRSTGKHPRTSNGLKAATTDEAQIRAWWTACPDANIGIVTGVTSRIFVVDVDGDQGEESLRRLIEENGPLPGTHTVKTGSGRQLYFRHPGGKVRNAAPIRRDFLGLDSRGDGGYVVAPPSLHYTRRRYTLEETSPTEIAEAPAWLIDFINNRPPTAGGALTLVVDNDRSGIADGSRNCTLTSMAGSMRAKGFNQSAIEAALLAHNHEQCDPPLADAEVRAIARSVANYAPGAPSDVLRTLTDAGNAKRFALQWRDAVRYVPELKCWLVWNGIYWQPDVVGAVMEMAKQTAFDIYREGDQGVDTDARDAIVRHSKLSQQIQRLEAMLKLAQSIPALVVPLVDLDADPWLLGVQNGTLDLRTGILMPARREDYITKVGPVAYDAEAECPVFLKFLNEIMGGDQALIDYLQRVLGYMLTGETSEQRLFFLYGNGANGKSTLLNVCKGLLGGELCRQTSVETILARGKK